MHFRKDSNEMPPIYHIRRSKSSSECYCLSAKRDCFILDLHSCHAKQSIETSHGQPQTPNMNQTFLLALAVTLIVLWLTLKFLAKRKVQNLHTKYVFITGCDSGFGRETAIRLDKMGIHVLAACLTKQGAQDLKSTASSTLKTFQMDVTDSQQIKDVFEQVKNLLPPGQGKENYRPRRAQKMTRIICGNNSRV